MHVAPVGARCMQSLNQLYVGSWLQVHLTMSCMQRRHPDCIVSCTLTADGTRAYKLDGKNRTAREIRVHFSSMCIKPLCGSASLLLRWVCIQQTEIEATILQPASGGQLACAR